MMQRHESFFFSCALFAGFLPEGGLVTEFGAPFKDTAMVTLAGSHYLSNADVSAAASLNSHSNH